MTCTPLVYRMIISALARDHQRTRELCEAYLRERHLYVTIKEILEAKKKIA